MKLIIHADDFGMAESINTACIELCRLKTLSSVSVMANMPYSDQVVELLPLKHVSLGLHSTFTEGAPLLPVDEVSSLVDDAGNFYKYPEMMRRAKAKKLSSDDIYRELKAQYARLKERIGDRLSFVDSHHSIHNKLVPFRDAFIRFGREVDSHAIRTRQMHYLDVVGTGAKLVRPDLCSLPRFGLRKVLANYFYRNTASKFKGSYTIPDGMIVEDQLGAMNVFRALPKLDWSQQPDKTYYAVTHPAVTIDDLPETNLKEERLQEFEILKSKEFVEFVGAHPLSNFEIYKSV